MLIIYDAPRWHFVILALHQNIAIVSKRYLDAILSDNNLAITLWANAPQLLRNGLELWLNRTDVRNIGDFQAN